MGYGEKITGKRLLWYFIPVYGIFLYFWNRTNYSIIIKEPISTLILVLGGYEVGFVLSRIFLFIDKL